MSKTSIGSEEALAHLEVLKAGLRAKAIAGILEAGHHLEGKMAEKISLGKLSPALTDETIAKKGSSKPLFDNGHLLQQIDSRQTMDSSVEVGVFDGPEKRAFIALVHEWGAPSRNIPERSFMRSAYNENKKGMKKLFIDTLKK